MEDFDIFQEQSRRILADFTSSDLRGLLESRALRHEGVWHPNGFAIWEVRHITNLGTIRLHIWPGSNRIVRDWGPTVHRHGWHLASHVICGVYADTIFDSVSGPAPDSTWQSMIPYRIDIHENRLRQVIPEDATISIRATEQRQIPVGGWHFIPAGVFHETNIPSESWVATVVIQGLSSGPTPLGLESQWYPGRWHQRTSVDQQEARRFFDHIQSLMAIEEATGRASNQRSVQDM